MSRSYNITKQIEFDSEDGYWTLSFTVNSATNLNPRVFLMEKFLVPGQSISTSENNPRYIRCLLRNEPVEVVDENSSKVATHNSWVMFRTATLERVFYTYSEASTALESMLAVLKSNTQQYKSLEAPTKPQLVVTNLSSKEKTPSIESVVAYKGDVLALQVVGGPRSVTVVSDFSVMPISTLSTRRVKSNSLSVKLLTDTHTYIGLIDEDTGVTYKVDVSMEEADESETTEVL